jgi:hypothetical protein
MERKEAEEIKLYCIELNVTSSEDLETIEEYLNYILNSTDKRIQSFEIRGSQILTDLP